MHSRPAAEVQQSAREIKDQSSLLDGQWSYMAGATKEKDGLHITNTGLAIVEQDGSGGQPNPPINLFGTHLEQAKDFRISATLDRIQGKASLQLYGQPPIIADEFRIERQSLRFSLQDDLLYIDLWDGSGQQPVVSQSAKITGATDKVTIVMRDEASNLYISVNGQVVATIPNHNVFSLGTVWFGADATQSWVLSDLQAKPVGTDKLTIADSSTLKVPDTKQISLQQLASARRSDFAVGAAMALTPAATDPSYAQIAFGGNFGSMTTENALKWQFVHPEPDVYTFSEADALVALAKRNNLAVHGHTLVFGEANPLWVQDLPTATPDQKAAVAKVMKDHITTVIGHYKGSIQSWDVVNEPLADYDNFDTDDGYILRRHKWYQAMGEGYISEAFHTARAADPTAKLFINEYGLEENGERWDAFLSLVKRLKASGVPIDGVGFQAHVYDEEDRISVSDLRSHIKQLAKIGLVARISENDIYSYEGTDVQANQYADVFNACFSEPNCIGYTTWGVSDRYDTYKDDDGNIAYGEDFLWSKNMEPTPAVTKLQSLLGQ
jgi:endo-1,4-beta-xylanase